jgi:hypothetical protein
MWKTFKKSRCSKKNYTKYVPTIGLEIHAQIKSNTKLFRFQNNFKIFQVEHQLHLQGHQIVKQLYLTFPFQELYQYFILCNIFKVLNKFCVEQAIKTSLALNGKVNEISQFDRKVIDILKLKFSIIFIQICLWVIK